MNRIAILKLIYWLLFALVIGAFYVGLRSDLYKVHYTLLALVLWGATYGINILIDKEKSKRKP